jgi:hypothetical protein
MILISSAGICLCAPSKVHSIRTTPRLNRNIPRHMADIRNQVKKYVMETLKAERRSKSHLR